MEDLAEALRGDQADAGALGLQHGVGGDGRAMDDVAEVAGRDPGLLADARHAGEDAFRGILRG